VVAVQVLGETAEILSMEYRRPVLRVLGETVSPHLYQEALLFMAVVVVVERHKG
jgi:hypothetical protein